MANAGTDINEKCEERESTEAEQGRVRDDEKRVRKDEKGRIICEFWVDEWSERWIQRGDQSENG